MFLHRKVIKKDSVTGKHILITKANFNQRNKVLSLIVIHATSLKNHFLKNNN